MLETTGVKVAEVVKRRIEGIHITEYRQDTKGFYQNTKAEIKEISDLIKTPWGENTHKYEIQDTGDNGGWVCMCKVDNYTNTETKVYGYGGNPDEALAQCIKRIKSIKEYKTEKHSEVDKIKGAIDNEITKIKGLFLTDLSMHDIDLIIKYVSNEIYNVYGMGYKYEYNFENMKVLLERIIK